MSYEASSDLKLKIGCNGHFKKQYRINLPPSLPIFISLFFLCSVSVQKWGWRKGVGGVGKAGEMSQGGAKVQTSSCKINKSWECNIQHGDYS